MPDTVLILGATGRLGQALTEAFARAGWAVRAQARRPLPASLADLPGVQEVRCDALEGPALRAAASGATAVVHALNPPYTQWDRLVLPLLDAAIDAARSSGALLMYPGNVYNFGRELPPLLASDTPEVGDTPKARLRIASEARLAAAEVDSVVVRAGDFFGGAGRGAWFDLVVTAKLQRGRVVLPGPPDRPHAWAYLPDLAQAFVRLAAQRAGLAGHRRFHFAGHTLSGEMLHRALEEVTGRPLRLGTLPWRLFRLAAPVVPMFREMGVMRYLWERAHQLDGTALRQQVGDLPHTLLPQALAAALAALGMPPHESTPGRPKLTHPPRGA